MSTDQESDQVVQRRANLEELEAARRRRLSAPVRAQATDRGRSSRAHGAKTARGARGRASPHARRPAGSSAIRSFGKANFLVALRRQGARSGLHPAGRAAGARLQDLQAARLRRLGRRRGPAVPDEDERVDDLGVAARVPGQVPAAAAGEVARPAGRRDSVPAAVSRSHRQPGLAAGVRGPQPRRHGDPRVPDRARVPRSRDADDAADRRRRAGAAVRDASQRARHARCSCASRRSCT